MFYKRFPNGFSGHLPEFWCDECDEPMEFDDLPERYFAFLSEH